MPVPGRSARVAMRPAGRFVAEVLAELAPRVQPGVNLFELDGLVHDLIRERSATFCYIDYHLSFGAGSAFRQDIGHFGDYYRTVNL